MFSKRLALQKEGEGTQTGAFLCQKRGKHGLHRGELKEFRFIPDVSSALLALAATLTKTSGINNDSWHVTECKIRLFSHPGESPLGLFKNIFFYSFHCQAVCLHLFTFLCTCPMSLHQIFPFLSLSLSLSLSRLWRCLCSHRSWRIFWRSVTWCSPACSAWRCCWSSWLWGSLATSRIRTTASTASLSSSGEVLVPLGLWREGSPGPAGIARAALKRCQVNLRFRKISLSLVFFEQPTFDTEKVELCSQPRYINMLIPNHDTNLFVKLFKALQQRSTSPSFYFIFLASLPLC